MKKCSKCKTIKKSNMFPSDKRRIDGLHSNCKACEKLRLIKRAHSKKGLVSDIYSDQKRSSRKRGDAPPQYTKEELEEWVFSQNSFNDLYDSWCLSGFLKKYRPSIDRKNDYIGYMFLNIRLTTWDINNKKGSRDRKRGINNKQNKSVLQFSLDGKFLNEYHSISEAGRILMIRKGHISEVCSGKRNSTGGYSFKINNIS